MTKKMKRFASFTSLLYILLHMHAVYILSSPNKQFTQNVVDL